MVGAYIATLISIGFLGFSKTFTLVPPQEFLTGSSASSLIYLLLVEALFTMILVSTVLFVKYRKVSATSDGMLSNLTVAIAVYVCVRMAGPLSGAGLNPTIAIAIITTDSAYYQYNGINDKDAHLKYLISYIIGPILGGLAASGLLLLS